MQWSEPVEPGTAELVRHDDGTVTVRRADPVIAVDPAVLTELGPAHLEADGTLRLDTAGTYRYQHVGERTVHGRTERIYRRLHRPTNTDSDGRRGDGDTLRFSRPVPRP